MSDEKKLVEFDVPEGLMLPEGLEEGGRFEFMATFQLKGPGRMCLVEVDGNAVAGYRDKKASESPMTDAYRKEMPGAAGASGGAR